MWNCPLKSEHVIFIDILVGRMVQKPSLFIFESDVKR